MAEIKCPNCGTLISLKQSDLDSVVTQVRDEQFQRELDERVRLLEEEKASAIELAKTQAQARLVESEGRKDAEIAALKAEMASRDQAFAVQKELAVAQAVSELEEERRTLESSLKEKDVQLQAQKQQFESQQQLTIAQAVAEVEKQRDELGAELKVKGAEYEAALKMKDSEHEAALKLKDSEHAAEQARLHEQLVEQERVKDEVIAYQKEELERMKDMKARLSTKMVGETLEQHCQYEFDRIRAVAFPNAYFEKDNEAAEGTKGDFIFREEDEDGNEVISIMFEMKNLGDTNSVKKKNEDHLAKLDKDRTKKNCEYAILVSRLAPDNELYNEGIVDVSHRYPKMYVVRPQFFIPIISLLRNAALGSMQYKRELALVRQQDLDITTFEQDLDLFKQGFFKNFGDASLRFEDAIKAIDKAIADLERAKDKLLVSEKHLTAANNKLEGLTVKKLTRKNPTMRAKFKALEEADEDEDA